MKIPDELMEEYVQDTGDSMDTKSSLMLKQQSKIN